MRKALFIITLFICCSKLMSQGDSLVIDVNILHVVSMAEGNKNLPSKGKRKKVFQPEIITFNCYLSNYSDQKKYLFDSNTLQCFRTKRIFKDEPVMGCFYLVNGQDSLLLFSRSTGVSGPIEGKSVPVWINFRESSSFRRFLKRFSSNDEQKSKRELFDYLKKSKLIYVPIQNDYEQVIREARVEKESIIYPTQTIDAKMPYPFTIVYSVMYDDDNLDFYSD